MVPKFSAADLHQQIVQAIEARKKAMGATLHEIGERFIALAQANADFMNHTYNLRSSIGFAVVIDGTVTSQVFKTISTGADGTRAGREVIDRIIADGSFNKRMDLIVVAGESYAAAVEAKGRDVLTGTGIEITRILKQAMKA